MPENLVIRAENDTYMVRYRELLIPAKLSDTLGQKPATGSDVRFIWDHKSTSTITKVLKNKRSVYCLPVTAYGAF